MAQEHSPHRLRSGFLWVLRWFVLPPVLVYAFVFATGALWDTFVGRIVMFGMLGVVLAGLFTWAWQIEKRKLQRRKSTKQKTK